MNQIQLIKWTRYFLAMVFVTTLQEDFQEEQNAVASIVHMFENDDVEQLFAVSQFTCVTTEFNRCISSPESISDKAVPRELETPSFRWSSGL
jgi:hypothetical protein